VTISRQQVNVFAYDDGFTPKVLVRTHDSIKVENDFPCHSLTPKKEPCFCDYKEDTEGTFKAKCEKCDEEICCACNRDRSAGEKTIICKKCGKKEEKQVQKIHAFTEIMSAAPTEEKENQGNFFLILCFFVGR
jgi:hypothetical protein